LIIDNYFAFGKRFAHASLKILQTIISEQSERARQRRAKHDSLSIINYH